MPYLQIESLNMSKDTGMRCFELDGIIGATETGTAGWKQGSLTRNRIRFIEIPILLTTFPSA